LLFFWEEGEGKGFLERGEEGKGFWRRGRGRGAYSSHKWGYLVRPIHHKNGPSDKQWLPKRLETNDLMWSFYSRTVCILRLDPISIRT